jgi:membrane protein DedA with SNARE-associated domain
MVDWLEQIFISYSETIPLEIIVLFFSIFEEIIPPVPAFPVLILSGGLANLQGYFPGTVMILVLLAALGKTIGAVCVYKVVDKVKGVFVEKYGRFFDIAPGDLEKLGAKLGKGGARDMIFLTTVRAIPIIPSTLISVGSGLLNVKLRTYILATFFGSIIRISFYIYAGYFSADVIITFLAGGEELSSTLQWSVIGLVGGILVYLFWRNFRQN